MMVVQDTCHYKKQKQIDTLTRVDRKPRLRFYGKIRNSDTVGYLVILKLDRFLTVESGILKIAKKHYFINSLK